MLSNIQMTHHGFLEISIKPNQTVEPGDRENCAVTIQQQFSATPSGNDTSKWIGRLKIELVPPSDGFQFLYTGMIEMFGEFSLHPEISEEDRIKYACINGGALLFGAAREMVAMLTSRSIHGMIELPSVDPRTFLPKDAVNVAPANKKKPAQKRKQK
jgi:hypothetical protein